MADATEQKGENPAPTNVIKKQKHNTRRRKSKKSENVNEDSGDSDVVPQGDEIVSPVATEHTSGNEDKPSSSNLHNLLENLQIHTAKNPIKEGNVTEFLNVELLKKTKGQALNLQELEKIKEKQQSKVSQKPEVLPIPTTEVKEYFNINLIKNCPEQSVLKHIERSSMQVVSELESLLIKKEKTNNVGEFFNLQAKENIVESIQSTSETLVSALEKTVLKKTKTVKRRKAASMCDDTGHCSKGVQTDNPNPRRRKPKERSISQPEVKKIIKEDFKFPEYLGQDEIESIKKYDIVIEGNIRINQKNYKEAYMNSPDKGQDIIIEGIKDRNRALEGDQVYLILKAPKQTKNKNPEPQKRGFVVFIKTLNHCRGGVGHLKPMLDKNCNYILFCPRDSRLPRMRVPKESAPSGFIDNPDSFKNVVFYAKIVKWNDTRYAEGALMQTVGLAGEIATETQALLLNNGLDTTPYPSSFSKEYPSSPYIIPQSERAKREDRTKDCIFTIDPATARDLDDAVSAKLLDNGNWEVGVHISDVAFFLKEGSDLDTAVAKRATTIYLVQEVHHMLPRDLCLMCSLTPGEDKLAFSCFWEVTPDLDFVKYYFVRSVINSCAQLSYEQVQDILDGGGGADIIEKLHSHSLDEIKTTIKFLNTLAVKLRKGRFDNGALQIQQTKISFSLDKDGFPDQFHVYINMAAHRLIEELMLLANSTAAAHILKAYPNLAFLRSHSEPSKFILDKLQKTLEKFGVIIDCSSAGKLHESLCEYSGESFSAQAMKMVLSNVLAKPMMRARYFCAAFYPTASERHHYALNVPLYTHFTSPIRRYADIMVHRLLAASLGLTDSPNWKADNVQKVANICNIQKHAAKLAGEASTELFFTVWLGFRGGVVFPAAVCDLKDKSFDCIVLATGTQQRIYYEHIKGILDIELKDGIPCLKITWPGEPPRYQIIEMFSIINVKLERHGPLKIIASLMPLDDVE